MSKLTSHLNRADALLCAEYLQNDSDQYLQLLGYTKKIVVDLKTSSFGEMHSAITAVAQVIDPNKRSIEKDESQQEELETRVNQEKEFAHTTKATSEEVATIKFYPKMPKRQS